MSKRIDKQAVPASRDDFAQLSDAFYARLSSDRVHLVALSAALAQAEEDPRETFEELRFRAHKLNGAAGIFEASDVMAAAEALEQAATRAIQSHAANSDDTVWSALQTLVNLLGSLEYGEQKLSA